MKWPHAYWVESNLTYGPSLIFHPSVVLITVIVLLLSLISNALPLLCVGDLSNSGRVKTQSASQSSELTSFVFQTGAHSPGPLGSPGPAPGSKPKASASAAVRLASSCSGRTKK